MAIPTDPTQVPLITRDSTREEVLAAVEDFERRRDQALASAQAGVVCSLAGELEDEDPELAAQQLAGEESQDGDIQV